MRKENGKKKTLINYGAYKLIFNRVNNQQQSKCLNFKKLQIALYIPNVMFD